jgi:hypothetical protein
MEPMPKMDGAAFVTAMRQKMEAMLAQVAAAINQAPDGAIIAGSEEHVRDLFGALRQEAFATGLQMRIDAAQAAFSPSAGSRDRQEAPQ